MKLDDLAGSALFLDLDGTLIDIALTPGGVTVPEGLGRLVGDLTRRLDGALAIVTGRSIAEVDRFLAPLAPVAAGVHGAELRMVPHGSITLIGEPADAGVVEAVQRLVEREPGTLVELKSASVAVHYRLVPSAEPRIEEALRRIVDDGPEHLILSRGRKVLEIVPTYVSKGAALAAIMDLPAFRGRRPVMIGDDASDQTAFEVAARFGGCGLKVAGELFGADEADFTGPVQVRSWLALQSQRLVS